MKLPIKITGFGTVPVKRALLISNSWLDPLHFQSLTKKKKILAIVLVMTAMIKYVDVLK